ncbi:hypothetical protein DID78_00490 [Candidatus Marinamargulisbacteria bacterium SCGC AG-343-D04]|nr:hypothetical protein DID78_00490 [Candidatus Marinamargulisbacteria bacterium SCGC AG-343-D04]
MQVSLKNFRNSIVMIEQVWGNSNQRVQQHVFSERYSEQDFSLHDSDQFHNSDYDSPPKNEFGFDFSHSTLGENNNLDSFLSSLKPSHSNTMFQFRDNAINDNGFVKLCNFLKNDTTVKHLILDQNQIIISEFAKAAVMDMLKVNHYIGWLVLSGNAISNIGAGYLAEALKDNTSLKHLILSDNDIGNEGITSLLISLKDHPTLESLFISGNPFDEGVFPELCTFISESRSLKRVDIRSLDLSASNLCHLLALCQKHCVRLMYE